MIKTAQKDYNYRKKKKTPPYKPSHMLPTVSVQLQR